MLRKSVPNNHYRHDDQNPKDRIIGGGHGMARNRASFILIHQNWRTRNDRFAKCHGTEVRKLERRKPFLSQRRYPLAASS